MRSSTAGGRKPQSRHQRKCRGAVAPGPLKETTDADSGRAKARGRGTANDEKVTTASGKTDASHGQREREVQARHHVTATPDGGIVHVHGESQMHARDTAGVRETAGSSGHIDGGDGGVEKVTEAEYMRGVKRKRDPG